LKRSGHILAAAGIAQTGLRSGRTHSPQGVHHRNSAARRNGLGQQFRLVEASLPLPPPMKRNRCDQVEDFVAGQDRSQQLAQRLSQGPHLPVLVEVDQGAQGAFIRAVAVRSVKTAKAVAAQSATAFGIQWERVLERRSTTTTEKLRT
jgi:hypothetical protein